MLSLLLASLALGADPAATSEAVELKTDTGTLFGTFDLPATKGPWTVVFVHPGSGPTDRDGNSSITGPDGKKIASDSLKLLGAGLAANGFACLRIDKRGVAASAKALAKEEDISLDVYAADAAAWTKLLRKDERFDRVAFVGHSEGSMIGAIAAADAPPDVFVSLCGPGRKLGDVLRAQLKDKLPGDLGKRNEEILTALEKGEQVDSCPKELAALYRPSVQPYLISAFKHDPAKEFGALKCPAFVVSGTTDIQVAEADGKALLAANKAAEGRRLENMNHVLREIDTTAQLTQMKAYTDPKLPLHPQLVKELTAVLAAKK